MQQLNNLNEQKMVEDSILELDRVNKQLAQLLFRKEELTRDIVCAFSHSHEGQKTYEYGTWKVEIKTPCVYSLNKKSYRERSVELPTEFNPIKQSISYTIDKRLCDHYMQVAPDEVREILIELIDKKPGKAAVTIKERV